MNNIKIYDACYYIANKYFGQYKTKGQEIEAVECPFCKHTIKDKTDLRKFNLNYTTGVYHCFRNSCQEKGFITALFTYFHEDISQFTNNANYAVKSVYKKTVPPKKYNKPTHDFSNLNLTDKAIKFFAERKITKQTLELAKVKSDNNRIIFEHYDLTGKVVNIKYRSITEKSFTSEPKCKPIFYNMQNISKNYNEPLVITEGQCDTLACIEAGFKNTISIPNGVAGLDCFDICWDWIDKFKRVYLFMDFDEHGKEATEKILKKLGSWRCYIVEPLCSKDELCCKDANDLLIKHGAYAVIDAIEQAKELKPIIIKRTTEIENMDYTKIIRFKTQLKEIDEATGGLSLGSLVILAGQNGSGKSSIINHLVASALENEIKTAMFSGELGLNILRMLLYKSIAGSKNLEQKKDSILNKIVGKVTDELYNYLDNVLYDKLFFLENLDTRCDDNMIFESMEYVVKRYNTQLIVLDNLMSINLNARGDSDKYQKQSDFAVKLKHFAKNNNVCIILAAHTRKPANDKIKMSKHDISGSADITNIADLVLYIHRRTQNEIKEDPLYELLNCYIEIFKNRLFGIQNIKCDLMYDFVSGRFSAADEQLLHYKYSFMINYKGIIQNAVENTVENNEVDIEEIPF